MAALDVQSDERIVVAVSGGSDSTALLLLLADWAARRELSLAAAHFDHRLRPESGKEAEQVGELCRRLGVPCEVGFGRVAEFARIDGRGVHAAARKLRLQFLAAVARDWGEVRPALVALGHQLDDTLETTLMRLFSGSGVEGLASLARRSPSPQAPDVAIIRPLLGFRRGELIRFCYASGFSFVEDRSNDNERYPRSRMRRIVIPLLEERLGEASLKGIVRSSRLAASAGEFVAAETGKAFRESLADQKEDVIIIDYNQFSSYHTLLRLGVIQHSARVIGGGDVRIALERVESADRTAARGNREVELGEGIGVQRNGAQLAIYLKSIAWEPTALKPGEGASIPGFGAIQTAIVNRAAVVFPPPEGALYIDLAAFNAAPAILRPASAGDRIIPLGSSRRCSVLDQLRDAGVPPYRRNAPLLQVVDAIAAIIPFRIAESFKLTGASKEALRIVFLPEQRCTLQDLQEFYDRPEPLLQRP